MVADGNPSAFWALSQLALQAGIEPLEVSLTATSRLVNLFHGGISADPEKAARYTADSEAARVGTKARLYAKLSFLEFQTRLRQAEGFEPTNNRWNIIQEHALLGSSIRALRNRGISSQRLIVPDVYPKESGILAAQAHEGTTIAVWNQTAFAELQERGIASELIKPFLLDGLLPFETDFADQGKEIVVKSSGSGMPAAWSDALRASLHGLNGDWAMHTPGSVVTEVGSTSIAKRKDQIQEFYNNLGGRTRLLIGYPSELVEVMCELRARSVPVWMITLPPRGSHEKRNLQFALENDIVLGELRFKGDEKESSLPGLRQIDLNNISKLVSWGQPDFLTVPLGTTSVWEDKQLTQQAA